MLSIRRRALIRGGLAGACGLIWPLPGRSEPRPTLLFEAFRDGDPIGYHRVAFARQGDRLMVEIEISLTVTFAFIPVYRYRHRNREVWVDGRLRALDSSTDDDGTSYRVTARAEGDRLRVDGADGRLLLPGDLLPTSYWQEAMVTRDVWLDTQHGRPLRASVEAMPPEPILAAGRTVEATRYRLAGEFDCEVWYHEGRWSKLRFAASDGSIIDYRLEAGSGA